jgi:competence protein CoiA
MLLALQGRELLRATPGARAECVECGERLIAKCGEIIIWHWAHDPGSQCAYSHESAWHLGWKLWAHARGCQIEKVVVPGHRADIVTRKGRVIELQSRGLALEDVRAREAVYPDMAWIVLVDQQQEDRLHFGDLLSGGGRAFWYRRGPKWITFTRKPLFLHLGADPSDALWHVRTKLVERTSHWGVSQRVLGRAWLDDRYLVFSLERQREYDFCVKHRSFWCPCVAPWFYRPPFCKDEYEALRWPA